jgi:branched-chain amino acid transport system substrate-binding protein
LNRKAIAKTQAVAVIVVIVVAVVAGAIFTSPLFSPKPQGAEKQEIVVGFTISKSGFQAAPSDDVWHGEQVWMDQVSKGGGIFWKPSGKRIPLRVVNYDDQSDMGRLSSSYDTLITKDKVDALLSPQGSTLTLAAAAVAAKYQKVIVASSVCGFEVFSQGYTNLYGSFSVCTDLYRPVSTWWKQLNLTRIALIWQREPFLATDRLSLLKYAQLQGLQVTADLGFYSTETNFIPLIQSVMASKADVLDIEAYAAPAAAILAQAKSLGYAPKMIFSFAMVNFFGQMVKAGGNDTLYVTTPMGRFPRISQPVDYGLTLNQFLARTNEMFPGYIPSSNALSGYTAGLILQYLIEQTGSVDPKDIRVTALGLTAKGGLKTAQGLWGPTTDGSDAWDTWPYVGQVLPNPQGQPELYYVWPNEVKDRDLVSPFQAWSKR